MTLTALLTTAFSPIVIVGTTASLSARRRQWFTVPLTTTSPSSAIRWYVSPAPGLETAPFTTSVPRPLLVTLPNSVKSVSMTSVLPAGTVMTPSAAKVRPPAPASVSDASATAWR